MNLPDWQPGLLPASLPTLLPFFIPRIYLFTHSISQYLFSTYNFQGTVLVLGIYQEAKLTSVPPL